MNATENCSGNSEWAQFISPVLEPAGTQSGLRILNVSELQEQSMKSENNLQSQNKKLTGHTVVKRCEMRVLWIPWQRSAQNGRLNL